MVTRPENQYGGVMEEIVLTRENLERFWSQVIVQSVTGCWEWTGPLTSDKGHGARLPEFRLAGRKVNVRRLSYLIHLGSVPRLVGCTCGNRLCVSPRHLTPALASKDCVGKVYKPKTKEDWVFINEKTVRQVVTLGKLKLTQPEICRRTGLGQSRISLILQMARLCRENKLRPIRKKRKVVPA
jgi:hypothetical protein